MDPNSQRGSLASRRKRKRGIGSGCADDEDFDREEREWLKNNFKRSDTLLACPFAKHDPMLSRGCWDFAVDSLARLKEHLLRRHAQAHCPVCFGTFDSFSARDKHLRHMNCVKGDAKQRGPWMQPDAVSMVRQRTKHGENAALGWARIYSILFPEELRSPSPFVEDIGELYTQRVRETVAKEFIQQADSALNDMPKSEFKKKPSAVRSACIWRLRGVADQYISKGSDKCVVSTGIQTQSISSPSDWAAYAFDGHNWSTDADRVANAEGFTNTCSLADLCKDFGITELDLYTPASAFP